jgi:hypothetical protein
MHEGTRTKWSTHTRRVGEINILPTTASTRPGAPRHARGLEGAASPGDDFDLVLKFRNSKDQAVK